MTPSPFTPYLDTLEALAQKVYALVDPIAPYVFSNEIPSIRVHAWVRPSKTIRMEGYVHKIGTMKHCTAHEQILVQNTYAEMEPLLRAAKKATKAIAGFLAQAPFMDNPPSNSYNSLTPALTVVLDTNGFRLATNLSPSFDANGTVLFAANTPIGRNLLTTMLDPGFLTGPMWLVNMEKTDEYSFIKQSLPSKRVQATTQAQALLSACLMDENIMAQTLQDHKIPYTDINNRPPFAFQNAVLRLYLEDVVPVFLS